MSVTGRLCLPSFQRVPRADSHHRQNFMHCPGLPGKTPTTIGAFRRRAMDVDGVDRRGPEQSGVVLENNRRLTIELATAKTLQAISQRLISESTCESLYIQILDAAITLMAADAASVQMLTADHESLLLLGWRN